MKPHAKTIRPGGITRRSFTLVELIVVVAIIGIILALTLPGMTAMWAERKLSETEAKIAGAVKGARASALRNRAERGVLFMIDPVAQVQRLYRIEAEPPNSNLIPVGHGWEDLENNVTAQDAKDRFFIRDEETAVVSLPDPIRAVPRQAVDLAEWSLAQLSNMNYRDTTLLRHRNFFTVIFNAEGQLVVDRTVYIHDIDPPNPGGTLVGSVTGLDTAEWPPGSPILADMVVDDNGEPLNFPSVDGLLVYDNASFTEYGDPALRRDYLIRTGQPLYFARHSGEIIRGPQNENQ